MLIVTGGAGFIGSALVWKLNQEGINDIIIVDRLGDGEKWKNLVNLKFYDYIEIGNENYKDKNLGIEKFLKKLKNNDICGIKTIFHMGACSSTTEKDASYLVKNNFEFSKELAIYAKKNNIDFFYASSAATYGDGSLGYDDNLDTIHKLKPLNMYGYSKQMFDIFAKQNSFFSNNNSKFIGFKFFNVYGPNEYHKGDMKSLIVKAYNQILKTGQVNLFKSYKPLYKDGEQKRDFIYIKDVVNIIFEFYKISPNISGIFNIGTGTSHTWNELSKGLFLAMNKQININYIDMPENLIKKYQYFTEANMTKTFSLINYKFIPFNNTIDDYVNNYLKLNKYLGEK